MIKDIAKELADAIVGSKEYVEYKKARTALEKDEENFEILEELRQRQWEIQLDAMLGKDAPFIEAEEVDEIYSSVVDNEKINQFLMAEYRFTKVLNDVQNILLASLESTKKNNENMSLH